MTPSISIIVATSGRIEKIRRLLESLCRVQGRDQIAHEIVIANNATVESTAAEVEALILAFDGRNKIRCWQVREPIAGKCRAQNNAIGKTQGDILAFLDDDVEVTPEWLQALQVFFQSRTQPVMQGAIIMRPEDSRNEELQKALHRFRTVDFLDYGHPPGTDLVTLTGGNMAAKREVFDQVGLFNEKLGPGGLGISEDVEFAKRVLKAGKRIGWEPKAAVYNELDPSRLNEESFRLRHELQGRSRLAYKNNSIFSIVPDLLRSVWTFGWYSMVGNERKRYRAKGRYYHYRAMLQEKIKSAKGNQV